MTAGITATVGLVGRLEDLSTAQLSNLLDRGLEVQPGTSVGVDSVIEASVTQIIADVRTGGDDALLELSRRFDRSVPTALEVPAEACQRALQQLDPQLKKALALAAANISKFHQAQMPGSLEIEVQPGVRVGRRAEPLTSVGVYVPGGRASYPSSVLMGVIPAKAAGVAEVVVCTPPDDTGWPPAPVLAACALAGADRVFAVGGAGAIAAMALGSTSVPKVNKVVGPGNAYVTEAKRQLNGTVAIDSPAGPSEVLVVADETADPTLVALELLAQAEHDPRAAAIAVAVGDDIAARVLTVLEEQLSGAKRSEIIREALQRASAVLTVQTVDQALTFVNRYAPEHLLLMVSQPRDALAKVRNCGSIFLGPSSSVVFGDYVTGANHTLPTSGLARSYSGLSTLDFLRFATYQEVSRQAAAELAPVATLLADAEGLYAHAQAASARAESLSAQAESSWAQAEDPDTGTHEGEQSGAGAPQAGAPEATRAGSSGATASTVQFRSAYSTIELYDPGRTRIGVDLSDNTNLFDPHPSVAQALRNVRPEQVSRYPSVYANTLRAEIAALHGVEPENVSTGGGLDGVIDAAVRAFCEPGDRVAYPDPTFGMVSLFAQMNGVEPQPVPLNHDLDINADAIAATGASLTYICNPNNPTGKPVNAASLARLAEAAAGVVLLDEAYADFAGDRVDTTSALPSNALRLRTLSKAYGLAGLRVGYAIGPVDLVREIEKSRGPYKITASAEAAAVALLRTGKAWVADVIAQTVQNRERLILELSRRGLNPLESATNFVLVPLQADNGQPDNPAKMLGAALKVRGVAVRVFPSLPQIGPAIRVTVGPWRMMERFLAELDAVIASSGNRLSSQGAGGAGAGPTSATGSGGKATSPRDVADGGKA